MKPIHPPSIDHRPQSGARARSIRIPFANNLLVPFGTKSSASPFCAFTYPILRLRSARSRFRGLVVPLCVGSPRRSLFEIQLEFQSPNGTYLYLINTLAINVSHCDFTECIHINKLDFKKNLEQNLEHFMEIILVNNRELFSC